jgi:hypothetical protein
VGNPGNDIILTDNLSVNIKNMPPNGFTRWGRHLGWGGDPSKTSSIKKDYLTNNRVFEVGENNAVFGLLEDRV